MHRNAPERVERSRPECLTRRVPNIFVRPIFVPFVSRRGYYDSRRIAHARLIESITVFSVVVATLSPITPRRIVVFIVILVQLQVPRWVSHDAGWPGSLGCQVR